MLKQTDLYSKVTDLLHPHIPRDQPSFGCKVGHMGILKTVFVNHRISDSMELSPGTLSISIQIASQLERHWLSNPLALSVSLTLLTFHKDENF